MKNVLNKKIGCTGAVQIHVEPPPNNLIKSNNNAKLDKYCVKIDFFRGPTLQK